MSLHCKQKINGKSYAFIIKKYTNLNNHSLVNHHQFSDNSQGTLKNIEIGYFKESSERLFI